MTNVGGAVITLGGIVIILGGIVINEGGIVVSEGGIVINDGGIVMVVVLGGLATGGGQVEGRHAGAPEASL